jgi:hypothetical protein
VFGTGAAAAAAAAAGGNNGRKRLREGLSGRGAAVEVNPHFRRGLQAALASPSPVPWRDPANPLKVLH